MAKVLTFKEERRVLRLGERKGGTIAEIEPSPVPSLAEAQKGRAGEKRLLSVEGNNFDIPLGQEFVKELP